MNIGPSNTNRPAAGQTPETGSAARPESAAPSAPAGAPTAGGSVELSAEARTYLRLRERLDAVSTPDHEARIARLREAIEGGTYTVSGEAIANAMLRDPAVKAMLDPDSRG
jgi:negative regulator of flagellin synthesis FlgM